MQNKLFLKAADICELLEVKQTSAYEIIGNLNKELEEQGYLTLRGKVPTKYFVKRFYGVEDDLLNAVDRDVIGLQVGVELSYLTVPEQEMVEEVHESTGKYPSLEQAKKIRQHREEKTLTKEIVRLLVIGERKKKTTVTLKQDEIKKYFPPEYDEQKIRTVICQLLEEWSNQNH